MTARPQHHQKRRTALGGSIALLAVLGASAVTANQAFADNPDGAAKAGKPAGTAAKANGLSGETAPITARAVTAALQAAVAEVAEGTASDFNGWHDLASAHQTHDPLDDSPERDGYSGWFTFSPSDGSAGALVDIHVGDKGGMDYNQRTAEENLRDCVQDAQEECQVSELPDGSLLKTWVLHSIGSTGERGYETFYATRMVDDVIVSASSTNGAGLVGTSNEVTRQGAVLSMEQLVDIVSEPWWGYDLPEEFATAGESLPGYVEGDSIIGND